MHARRNGRNARVGHHDRQGGGASPTSWNSAHDSQGCSQANLVASRDADWSTEARETARVILDHIAARARASKYREVRTRFAGCNEALLTEAHNRFGVVMPFGGPTSSGMLTLHCPPSQIYALGSFLRDHGADTVSVASLDYVLDRENPLYAKLEAFLPRPDIH